MNDSGTTQCLLFEDLFGKRGLLQEINQRLPEPGKRETRYGLSETSTITRLKNAPKTRGAMTPMIAASGSLGFR